MTRPYVRHDSFTSKTWFIRTWDITFGYVTSRAANISLNLSAIALVKRGATYVNVWPDASATHTATNNKLVRFVDVTWHRYMAANITLNHSYVRHDSFAFETWLIHMRHHAQSLCHCLRQTRCVTWPIHTWDMTHSHLKHDSFVWLMDVWHHAQSLCHCLSQTRCVTWLVHTWDMTQSHLRHDSFVCKTLPIRTRHMSHSYVTSRSISLSCL